MKTVVLYIIIVVMLLTMNISSVALSLTQLSEDEMKLMWGTEICQKKCAQRENCADIPGSGCPHPCDNSICNGCQGNDKNNRCDSIISGPCQPGLNTYCHYVAEKLCSDQRVGFCNCIDTGAFVTCGTQTHCTNL